MPLFLKRQCDRTLGDGLPSAVDPTKGSWLHKKGGLKDGERNWMKGGRRNWKVRWFVLHTEKISWMESPGGKELGSLAVDTFDRVDMDPDNRNLFCLRSKTRDLWLKADDEGTTGAWVSVGLGRIVALYHSSSTSHHNH